MYLAFQDLRGNITFVDWSAVRRFPNKGELVVFGDRTWVIQLITTLVTPLQDKESDAQAYFLLNVVDC